MSEFANLAAEQIRASQLRRDIEHVLNCHCAEKASNTPDFVLAEYLIGALESFDRAVQARDLWYGISPRPGEG